MPPTARTERACHGIRHALVNAGEFAPLGSAAQGRCWRLGFAGPRDDSALLARLLDNGRCVATSADSANAFSADHRHHPIFDPHTGYSPTALYSVTVAAPSAALTDALTKVFFLAGPARALALVRPRRVDALWIDKVGRWQATPRAADGADLKRPARGMPGQTRLNVDCARLLRTAGCSSP